MNANGELLYSWFIVFDAWKWTFCNIRLKALLHPGMNFPRRSMLKPFSLSDRLHERSVGVFGSLWPLLDKLNGLRRLQNHVHASKSKDQLYYDRSVLIKYNSE